jgi:hypothetical protein
MVRAPTLSILLDCLKLVAKRGSQRNVLDVMVLRVLHAMLYTTRPDDDVAHCLSIATTHCVAQGLFRPLFSVLRDPKLSTFVVGILGALLQSVSGPEAIEKVYRLALKSHSKPDDDGVDVTTTNQQVVVAESAKTEESLPPSGSKRKKRSVSPKGKNRAPLQPLELSPSKHSHRLVSPAARSDSAARPSIWHEALREFLQDALGAARKLAENYKANGVKDVKTKKASRGQQRAGELVHDAVLVMGALRLVLYTIQVRCRSDQSNAMHLDESFSVANRILNYLQVSCNVLAEGNPTDMSEADWFVTQSMINCGVYAHFALQPFLTKSLKKSDVQSLRHSLDDFANLGCRLFSVSSVPKTINTSLLASEACHCSNMSSCLTSLIGRCQPEGTKTTSSYCDFKSPLCLCSLLADANTTVLDEETDPSGFVPYSFDVTMVVIDSLPMQTRCVHYLQLSVVSPCCS